MTRRLDSGHAKRLPAGAVALFVVLSLALLGGCRGEEQGRIVRYDEGTYLGKKDAPLEPDTVDALRQRARHQRM